MRLQECFFARVKIVVSSELREICPHFIGVAVNAHFTNTTYSAELWAEIEAYAEDIRQRLTTDDIKEMPSIRATRMVYKACGKDPSRYRPSAEALLRRVLQGKNLYQIDTAVDLINLASMVFGYSIGGFDADKIDGDALTLGIGREGEPYEGIGRGELNIQGLPVYRDATGGIGTPTSDHERTKMEISTSHILAIVNGYDGDRQQAVACASYIQELLRRYATSDGGTTLVF